MKDVKMLAQLIKVSKTIENRRIVDSVSFDINEGSTFAILGPNGAGKTTTIRLLTGLLTPDQGEIYLFGQRLTDDNSASLRSNIGVQNDGNLYEELTIEENLTLWGKLYELDSVLIKRRIQELLDLFDLGDRRDAKVSQLSKGMRQKVMVARAMLHHPKLLILDEPTTGLDPQSSETLTEYLKMLVGQEKMTVVFSTHLLEGLENLATHIGIIRKGKMLVTGNVGTLLHERWPEEEYGIVSNDIERVCEVCSRYGSCRVDSTQQQVIVSPTDTDISNLVNVLVGEGVKIVTVTKICRTIRDYYFDVLAGGSDEC
jgi:ABC-2 type transport system ATP-binding protein